MAILGCPRCKGTGKVNNPEYYDRYDQMEKTYPSPEQIERQLNRWGLKPTIPCPECANKKG
jgi:hypothetical protein